jgi:dipeptidase
MIVLFITTTTFTRTTTTRNFFTLACTDILVTPDASLDGSVMIAYNADSPTLYGVVYHYPSTNTTSTTSTTSTLRDIYDWDSGRYMGQITLPHMETTYNVVGNGNDQGLVIGETTFGGVSCLAWNQKDAIMDYGSLIYITLQYTKTIRDAIYFMVHLMDTYGYASGGETFSLADHSGDVWMMEVIGRGNDYYDRNNNHTKTTTGTATGNKMGAVWVAQKIPNGAIAAHANQARIQTFVRDDPNTVLYADDVVEVAVSYGLYPITADPLLFSFSDTYDPITFIEARQGEARVWSIYSQIADPDHEFQQEYEAYAMGIDLTKRMPLYIYPYRKVSLQDVVQLMSSHYEGTNLDSSTDVGAGIFASPYRPRPLEWTYDNDQMLYHNERNIATAKTGWNFIGQIRPSMPAILSTILWFACDDSSTSPRTPIYTASTEISSAYYGVGPQDGVLSPLLEFDSTRAFWIQNMVSNFAYSRWKDVYPVLQSKLIDVQVKLQYQVAWVDKYALQMYQEKSSTAAIQHVTEFSYHTADFLHSTWVDFYGELFVQFRDYYTIVPKPDDPLCGCTAMEPGLSDVVKKRIVDETGDHYRVFSETIDSNNEGSVVPLRGENGKSHRFPIDAMKQVDEYKRENKI